MVSSFFDRLIAWFKQQKAIPIWGWIFGILVIFSLGLLVGGGGKGQIASPAGAETDPFSTASLAFEVFFRLIIVLGLMYVFFIFLRRWQGGKTGSAKKRLSVIETLHLSPRRIMYLIRLEEREFLVGATDQAMSLIAETDDGLSVEETDEISSPLGSFSSLLRQTTDKSGARLFETQAKEKTSSSDMGV